MDTPAALLAARQALLAEMPDAWALYAFGSSVHADARADTDLDLAVLLPPGKAISDLPWLTASLAAQLGRGVELIDMRECGDFMRMEVLRGQQTLYAANPDLLLGWEAEAMTEYLLHLERIERIQRELEAAEWREAHADFIATHNATIKTEGLPLDEWRSF